jgi:hypothetical protein
MRIRPIPIRQTVTIDPPRGTTIVDPDTLHIRGAAVKGAMPVGPPVPVGIPGEDRDIRWHFICRRDDWLQKLKTKAIRLFDLFHFWATASQGLIPIVVDRRISGFILDMFVKVTTLRRV